MNRARFQDRFAFFGLLRLGDEYRDERAEREESYQPNPQTKHRAQSNRVFGAINPP